jgi:hypothetical protein
MSIDKSILKSVTTAEGLFRTPANNFITNNYLKQPKQFQVIGEPLKTSAAGFRIKGFKPINRFAVYTATENEFDIDVPGPSGSPSDWAALRRVNTAVDDAVTCSVRYDVLENAASRRKHFPELLGAVVQDVVICRNSPDFDKTPEQIKAELLQLVEDQVDAPPDQNQATIWSSTLEQAFDEAGIDGAFVKAWTQGPDALAAFASGQGIVGTAPAILAPYIGPEVQALAALPNFGPNFPQLVLYELGRAHGESWVAWLESSVDTNAKQTAGANAVMGKTLRAAFGDVEQIVTIPAISVARGRQMKERRKKELVAETRSIVEAQERAAELLLADTIADAAEWWLACETPGATNSWQLVNSAAFGVSTIQLECGDEDFARLNPPTLALAIANEVAARRGAPAPLVVGKGSRGSILPLLLAGGGFVVGGPLGAGVGFALGTTLDKRNQ